MAKLSLSNIMSTHDSALSRVINPKSTEFGYLGMEQRFIMLKNKATEDNSKCQKKIREYDIVLLSLSYM